MLEKEELQKYIIRKGIFQVADYYTKKIEEKRNQLKVPCVINNNYDITYWVDCDIFGVPLSRQINVLEYKNIDFNTNDVKEISNESIFIRKSIYIKQPLIIYKSDDFIMNGEFYFFMWEAIIIESDIIPLENINVVDMLKIINKSIEIREGIILNETIKNKIIK